MRHFVRGRLQRRLFGWFTLAMVLTGVAVAAVSGLLGRFVGPSPWRHNMAGAERFVTANLARTWDQPPLRDSFARDLSESFGVRVELLDASRRPLASFGRSPSGSPGGRPWHELAVSASRGALGFARVSPESEGAPWRVAVIFAIAVAVLWTFAGAVSRRIAWPFHQLAQVARDVGSGQLRARAPLRRQFGEARVLGEAINEMADRIERQLREQRELLAAVSHELRTPLARVRLLVELARSGGASEKLLADLDQEAIEMDRLVGELLANARVEFATLSLTQLDPVELATRALERAGLPVSLLVVEGPVTKVTADATLLLRALANLLENARRHAAGVTRLRVDMGSDLVRFSVEDAGPGFSPGEETRAFQPFGGGSRPSSHGSLGLGLSLVQRIARAHQGDASARNLPTGGAQVSFTVASTLS